MTNILDRPRRAVLRVVTAAERARGAWRPPVLIGGDSRLVVLLFVYAAAVRAYDYATGRDGTRADPGSPLSTVERAMPLPLWGAAIALGVVVLLIGMAGRWAPLVIAGHLVLAAIYASIFTGLMPVYLGRPWADGIRAAAGLVVPPVIHILCAVRTRWRKEVTSAPARGRA